MSTAKVFFCTRVRHILLDSAIHYTPDLPDPLAGLEFAAAVEGAPVVKRAIVLAEHPVEICADEERYERYGEGTVLGTGIVRERPASDEHHRNWK